MRWLISFFFFLVFLHETAFARLDIKNFTVKYKFDYSGMVVGKGKLDVKVDNSSLIINFNGKTVSLINLIYPVKVRIVDAIDLNSLKDIYYKSWTKTRHTRKFISVLFDNETTAKVTYCKNGDKENKLFNLKEGLFSPLSVYLFFLTHNYELGKTYVRYIVVSKHLCKVFIKPVGFETINLDSLGRKKGERKALKTLIKFYKLNDDGTIVKKNQVKQVTVWISTVPPQVPLLAKMWHVIGVFEAKLDE